MKNSNGKRRFSELRDIILRSLASEQKTINQISSETGINWKTVDNHLTYLAGKGLAKEIFSSKFVRIFEITDKGMEVLGHKKQEEPNRSKFEKKGEVNILQ